MADLDEIQDQLGDIQTSILELTLLLNKNLSQMLPAKPSAEVRVDTEQVVKELNVQLVKALGPLDKIHYTLSEAQKNANQEMADRLNCILERIYESVEEWSEKVAFMEESNSLLATSTKTVLNDLITPSIKNLLTGIKKELVNESRIANERINEIIRKTISASSQVQLQPAIEKGNWVLRGLLLMTFLNGLGTCYLVFKSM
jgi:hypothetical protein